MQSHQILVPLAMLLAMLSTATGDELPCDLNLVENPGCEAALVGGSIPGWSEAVGNGWTKRTSDPPPASGTGYFAAAQAELAELVQDVDVSAYAGTGFPFMLRGFVRSGSESPPDLARIVFEFRGENGAVLGTFDSGDLAQIAGWEQIFRCCEQPLDTHVIRVRLIGSRQNGQENNSYFDGLEVYPVCPLSVESSAWGLVKKAYR